MSLFIVGCDVGNYDIKTQNTTTPSSYKSYATKPQLGETTIFYDGMYYSPTLERDNQQYDKTKDNYCLIATLFGISKEILFKIKQNYPDYNDLQIQAEIDEIDEIKLGVGLPVGHYSAQATDLAKFYMKNWGNGVSFSYGNFNFSFKLVKCVAYPQDLSAVVSNKSCETVQNFRSYYVIGIGGGTVDIIPVVDGQPSVEKIVSLPLGTTVMYTEIIKAIQQETGKTMTYSTVEDVLMQKNSIIDDHRKNRIGQLAGSFINKLVDKMVQYGLNLEDFPCVFVGGGALMMKNALEGNPQFAKTEFLADVNANARYYAEYIK